MGNKIQSKAASNSAVPPRPPKPGRLSSSGSGSSQLAHDTTSSPDYPAQPLNMDMMEELYSTVDIERLLSRPMSLSEAMEEYGHQLPLMFSVSESLYGVCESASLMVNQLLSIHAMKETKIADVTTSWGAQYMVPLSTMLECSYLYDPGKKMEAAKKGHSFETVGELLRANPLPVMVYVESSDLTSSELESRVEKGEILILKQAIRNKNKPTMLECLCYQSKAVKLLNESCVGNFTTSMNKLRFSLVDIVDHLIFPTSVVLHKPLNFNVQLPEEATYTMTNYRTVRSIIASSVRHSVNKMETNVDIIEILQDMPIDVQLVYLSGKELGQLRLQTESLCNGFHPSIVNKVIWNDSSIKNDVQVELFKKTQEGHNWKVGVQLISPAMPRDSTVPEDTGGDVLYDDCLPVSSPQEPLYSNQDAPLVQNVQMLEHSFAVTNELYSNTEVFVPPESDTLSSPNYTCADYANDIVWQKNTTGQGAFNMPPSSTTSVEGM